MTQCKEPFAEPIFNGRTYSNPHSFTAFPSSIAYLKWKWQVLFHNIDQSKLPSSTLLEETLPVQVPHFNLESPLSATWLGHATLFVHLHTISFITDPLWADYAAPLNWIGYRRYRPPPCSIANLPPLHFVLISHNHYDHLDSQAVITLSLRFPHLKWFVPKGLGEWIGKKTQSSHVYELSWGMQHTCIIDGNKYEIWCIPAQHWSSRCILDKNTSLWCGWAVIGPNHKFYYTGDTGFCREEFRKLGNNLGPFDLSAIPIGCYAPRWFMKAMHIDPEEAVQIHLLTRSIHSIGIHWGSYAMGSNEPYLEPQIKLQAAAKAQGLSRRHIFTLPHGATWSLEQTAE